MFQAFCPHCMKDLLIDEKGGDRIIKCSCGGTFRVRPRQPIKLPPEEEGKPKRRRQASDGS